METAVKKVQKDAQPTKKTAVAKTPSKDASIQSEVDTLKKKLQEAEMNAKNAGKEARQAKEEVNSLQEKLTQSKPVNVMDAIVKVYEAKEIVARLEFLRDTKKSLSAFSLGRSELKDELSISDGSGNVFQTTNTNTIQVVLETLKKELDGKIQDTEQDLMQVV